MLAGQLQFLYGTLELACSETFVVTRLLFGVTIFRPASQPHGSATMGVAMAEPCITPLHLWTEKQKGAGWPPTPVRVMKDMWRASLPLRELNRCCRLTKDFPAGAIASGAAKRRCFPAMFSFMFPTRNAFLCCKRVGSFVLSRSAAGRPASATTRLKECAPVERMPTWSSRTRF